MDETSAIARKLQNYALIENEEYERSVPKKAEPGILKNILLITLMGAAVLFTQVTLTLVRWTKELEGT